MGFNRKERLKIANKIGKKNRPTNSAINWRLKKTQYKEKKEERLLQGYEEFKTQHDCEEAQYKADIVAEESAIATEDHKARGDQFKKYHLSIAVPGSILNNAQGPELRTYLAGQIARSCAIFCVDEVVVFDETARLKPDQLDAYYNGSWLGIENVGSNNTECNLHLARILEYLECPQYLRKYLFPIQRPLKFCGVLNPLDGMHHLRADNLELPYREGIVLDKKAKFLDNVLIDVGLPKKLVEIETKLALPANTRVTVKLDLASTNRKNLRAVVTSPKAVNEEAGIYWGYTVRIATCLSDAIKGYDVVVGTSERGVPVNEAPIPSIDKKRVLLVFGGLQGLESALDADESIFETDPAELFPIYVNSLPGQGSRIIRTEEAIPITLAAVKQHLDQL